MEPAQIQLDPHQADHENPRHGLDPKDGLWATKVGTRALVAENDKDAAPPHGATFYPHIILNDALDKAQSQPCPQQEHAEMRKAYAIADQIVKDEIRKSVPATAMLRIPPDEIAEIYTRLTAIAQTLVSGARDLAKTHGSHSPMCVATLTSDLQRHIKHHIHGDPKAKKFTRKYNPHHCNDHEHDCIDDICSKYSLHGEHHGHGH